MSLPEQHRVLLRVQLPANALDAHDTPVDQQEKAPVAVARRALLKVEQRSYPGDLAVQRAQSLETVQHQGQGCPDPLAGLILAAGGGKVILAGGAELPKDIPGGWLRPDACLLFVLH